MSELICARRPSHRLGVVLLAGCVFVAACSDGSDAGDEASTTTTGGESTSVEVGDPITTTAVPVPDDRESDGTEIVVPDPDGTLLDIDPAVRVGVLDNGLTYYVRENDSPGGRLELRLVVNAGSLQQDVPDSGLAHFLEHMLFNGTTNFPGNELDKAMQDLGLAIGPDVNAYTSFDETVYSLSVSTASTADIDQGFDILAEWTGEATLDPDDVVEERGVVREERRANAESAGGRQLAVFLDAYTLGSDYFNASPIGSAENILATTAEDARRYYDRWYRPDLMAVIAVGDLPVDVLENEIIERFNDLMARGDNQPRRDPSTPPVDEIWVDVILDEETAARRISLDYWIPSWDPSTIGGERLLFLEQVLGTMIHDRLNDEVDRGRLDAISPFAQPFGFTRHVRLLGFNFGGDDLAVATEQIIAELRRIEVNGFSRDELDRARQQYRGLLDQQLAGVGTRQDSDYADAYVAHYLSGSEIDGADATHERLNDVLDRLTAEEMSNHFRYLMSISAPLLAGLGQAAETMPSVEELRAALDRGLAAEVQVDEGNGDGREVVALMDRPDRVQPVSVDELRDLVAFQLRFENGATAMFIHSDISEGAVDLFALSDGGWSVLSNEDAQLAGLATTAVEQSGLGELDSVDLNRFLAGKVVSLTPFIDEVDEGFVGNAAVDDLEELFQLLHLSVVAPRVDEAAFRSAIEAIETGARGADSDPQTLSIIELFDARYGGSEWPRIVPDLAAVQAARPDDALRVYSDRLGKVDDLVVAVAGDVDDLVVAELFERYIGSLPSGESDIHVDLWPDPPTTVIERSVSAGEGAAGAGVDFLFSSSVDVDERTTLMTEIVNNIIRSRLFDSVREELGASYGASVFVSANDRPDEVVETLVLASGDPDRLDLIRDAVLEAVLDLGRNAPSVEEFERAKGILASDYELVGNFDLMTTLIETARGRGLDPFTRREASETISGITRDEVALFAQELFSGEAWIEVRRG